MAKKTVSNSKTINESTIDAANDAASIAGAAQSQWFARPADQKFASLADLAAMVRARRERSYQMERQTSTFGFERDGDENVVMAVKPDKPKTPTFLLQPTHYSFMQICNQVGVHSSHYRSNLRDRPDLVVAELNHIYSKKPSGVKVMGLTAVNDPATPLLNTDRDVLQAITGKDYGRIWDADVVDAAEKLLATKKGKAFHAPLDWSKQKRSLFGSDRDVFMFFVDGGSIVEGGGDRDQLNRGFYMWNSEVGSKSMGIATFMFRECCGNFGIWGAQDVRLIKIRHTSSGPERFVTEAIPALKEYTELSARPIEAAIKKAKKLLLPKDDDDFVSYFMKRDFNRVEIKRAKEFAEQEEGGHRTLWHMYNGFTAQARMLAFTDSKVDLEKRAGKLMDALVETA